MWCNRPLNVRRFVRIVRSGYRRESSDNRPLFDANRPTDDVVLFHLQKGMML